MLDTEARVRGCLLGGAVGDALGAPVEFLPLSVIQDRFGQDGPADLARAYGRVGAITDDTQMTMFTVEGLIRAWVRWTLKGICHVPSVVHHAYLRWLATQGVSSAHGMFTEARDGWLFGVEALHDPRAPGNSCIGALRRDRLGTVEEPINDSKGCGGVMRIAPVGFLGDRAFELGRDIAALTHGHPTGYLAAGFVAEVVHQVHEGGDLRAAIAGARRTLLGYPHHEETRDAVDQALALSERGAPTPERVESLGAGWVAEEALAIALYCALATPDFESAVRLAVTHSGDSDSTGCISGALLGAAQGPGAIPDRWLKALELRAELETLAADYARILGAGSDEDLADALFERYPGW